MLSLKNQAIPLTFPGWDWENNLELLEEMRIPHLQPRFGGKNQAFRARDGFMILEIIFRRMTPKPLTGS